MFHVFLEEKIVTACMLALLVISIFLKIMLGLLYQGMIKESDNMAATENKMLKQCKLKFANCYQLSNGVSNIPVFVDKFLNRLKWGPFTFETLYHLSGQAMLLSVVSAGVGICRSIVAGRTLGEILPFYIVSFFGLYLYFSISTVADVKKKKRILKVNLVDYLENHLSPRIDITRQDMEMLYGDTGTDGRMITGRVSAGGRGRGRQGRRTVELMPIGNMQSIEIRQPVDKLPMNSTREVYVDEDNDRRMEDRRMEDRRMEDRRMEDRRMEDRRMEDRRMEDRRVEGRHVEDRRMADSLMEDRIAPDSGEEDPAAVTEEELEALLKEFLTS